MKATLLSIVLATTLLAPAIAADTDEVSGTWSGSWLPTGGTRDAVTVELRLDSKGVLTGGFLSPVAISFTKASFNSKTRKVLIEAVDQKSAKTYKIDGKISGTEFDGTLTVDKTTGNMLLIKWTYVPPIGGR